jgi:aryl-alcohol dehydrogenase-like predicted oxidoreductase
MKFGRIPGVSKPVSRLVQGTIMVSSERKDESFALLDAIYGMGCNAFDTAHIYGGGDNERIVGEWVNRRGLRDDVVIIGKGAHHNADRKRVTPFDIAADIHDSLARFGFNFIDIYLLHRDDPGMPVGPIVDALNLWQRDGKIGAFGGSNWTVERIQAANDYAGEKGLSPFVASSPNFSLADEVQPPWPGCISISGRQGAEARAWYRATQFPLFPWSSLARGFFSGKLSRNNVEEWKDHLAWTCYGSEENLQRLERCEKLAGDRNLSIPQVALAYVLNQPLEVFPLVGCCAPEEFEANLEALDVDLTDEELAWLDLRADG